MPAWIVQLLPDLALFAGAALLLAMVPGPSAVLILRQTLRAGRRSALAATAANELGLLLWALVAALGLASLIRFSTVAYDLERFGGAAALIVLGVRSVVRARAEAPDPGAPPEAGRGGFRAGLVTILVNPKAAVFAASILPQFVPRGAPPLPTLLLLCAVWVVVDASWYVFLAWVANRAARLLTRPRVRQRLEQISGVVLVALGLRLAVERT
jgi:threonine/homoserine/homoserine lactone efflux protein